MKLGIRDRVDGVAKDVGVTGQKKRKDPGNLAKAVQGGEDRRKGEVQKKTGEIKRDTFRD